MSQWVRPLHQVTSATAEWHAPQTRSFATTTYCGKVLEGSIEVTNNDEKAEREGRCSACATRLAAHEGIVLHASPRTAPQTPTSPPVKKAALKKTAKKTAKGTAKKTIKRTAAKKTIKRTAAKKTIKKPTPKRRSSKAPAARRPVRRSGRGRA